MIIIRDRNKIKEAIQVCCEFNKGNKEREINGLNEAMGKFNIRNGLILTYDQEDEIKKEGKKIIIAPVWKWLLNNEL